MFYKHLFFLLLLPFSVLYPLSYIKAETRPTAPLPMEKNITSLNLCTDQILLSLEPLFKEEIVTPLASDCSESALCEKVRFVSTLPKIEETLWLHPPHLILEGLWIPPFPSQIAHSLNIPIYHFKNIENLDDIPKEIATLGILIGREEMAKKLEQNFHTRLQQLRHHPHLKPLTAAIIGVDNGPLLRHIVTEAGFTLIIPPEGGREEFLLRAHPDLLVITTLEKNYSLKENYLFPSILQKYFQGAHHIMIKARLTLCGTVKTLDVLDSLIKSYDILNKG